MKKFAFIVVCVILSGFAFQSCKQSDQSINNDVEKVLKEKYPMITSSTKDAVVTLAGMVDSQEEKTAAGESVRSVKHVKDVMNNIQVRELEPAAPMVNPDETIKSDINAKLQSGGYKDVKVEVSNGEVILSGDLKRSDLTKVMQIANESNPKKVTNNLKLK
ncbi:BON domain-containing protein [Prevotella sp. 10(H)]|uniref:BON domain-containing protein n=1 Tax=Prevotella sp. 10(H) TaxID=1158294 RepID=UPI000AFDD4F8|nr:BON domain-containing protein [Prevotella sp. 10(H)]